MNTPDFWLFVLLFDTAVAFVALMNFISNEKHLLGNKLIADLKKLNR